MRKQQQQTFDIFWKTTSAADSTSWCSFSEHNALCDAKLRQTDVDKEDLID